MIMNLGSRTDIPAFFAEWFCNRVKEGYVCVRNPYYPTQVTRYRLKPDVVDCLVFCTKNPAPMLGRLQELETFGQYWFVTITPYRRDIEPHVPSKEQVMDDFIALSRKVGVRSVCWRYDPIFISEKYSVEFHIKTFEEMARKLEGATEVCVISFVDLYEKTLRNFKGVKSVTVEERRMLLTAFVEIGKQYGMCIKTCAEGDEPTLYGVDVSGCLTREVLERALGERLIVPSHGKAREACACLLGNDIGMYNTCGHGCLYCYANYDNEIVKENCKMHNPRSPLLVGELRPEDVVRDAKQESYRNGQMIFTF